MESSNVQEENKQSQLRFKIEKSRFYQYAMIVVRGRSLSMAKVGAEEKRLFG